MIEWFDNGLDLTINFFVFMVALAPLERAFAAHEQPFFRREWFTDLAFYGLQNLVYVKITLWALVGLEALCARYTGFMQANWLYKLPFLVQFALVILLSDFCIYWAHRFSHKNDFLWRFHKVHHTAERLDWLAAFREHPIDNVYTRVVVNIPPLLLGFSLEAIATFVLFRGFWGNFIHSNTSFGLGPLKYLLGSPRLHHWHHDRQRNSQCNFANLMPLMDVLFGTFYDPGKMPDRYGIDDTIRHNYWSQILAPMLPARFAARFKTERAST